MPILPKIIVIQHGARHRYAIPRIFYRMGYLSKLVTDSHAGSRLGMTASIVSKFIKLPTSTKHLKERQILEIPKSFVNSTDRWIGVRSRLERKYGGDIAAYLRARDSVWYSLTKKSIFHGANILYSMGGENLALLHDAQNRGIKVIVDAFISPLNLRQTFEAKRGLGIPTTFEENQHAKVESHYKSVFQVADVILCPSRWVAEGVEFLNPQFKSKIQLCPYGSSLILQSGFREPIEGRIFWAGGDWFRKGLHHLAAAADILTKAHPKMEFRIGGISDPAVHFMTRFKNLNFLGKVDRASIEKEFASADMFVFPTLTEGMASVLVEAVSSGCPILTTRGAGFDALEDGKGGILFEPGDPQALAELIQRLYLDRHRLECMSSECVALASNYTMEAWAGRLKRIVESLAE
jgi:glycosyltransferase involved in cell wall biosynthesis